LYRLLTFPVLFAFVLLQFGCGPKSMEFDSVNWNKKVDGFYSYREFMIQDVMENQLQNGMPLREVIALLGTPELYHNQKEYEINYEISVDYGWNIDPMEGKELIIVFDSDSLVTDIRLKHWKRD
jgi:hypothetical protein